MSRHLAHARFPFLRLGTYRTRHSRAPAQTNDVYRTQHRCSSRSTRQRIARGLTVPGALPPVSPSWPAAPPPSGAAVSPGPPASASAPARGTTNKYTRQCCVTRPMMLSDGHITSSSTWKPDFELGIWTGQRWRLHEGVSHLVPFVMWVSRCVKSLTMHFCSSSSKLLNLSIA